MTRLGNIRDKLLTELGANPGAQGIMRHKEGFVVSMGKSLAGIVQLDSVQQEPQLEHAQKKQLHRSGRCQFDKHCCTAPVTQEQRFPC